MVPGADVARLHIAWCWQNEWSIWCDGLPSTHIANVAGDSTWLAKRRAEEGEEGEGGEEGGEEGEDGEEEGRQAEHVKRGKGPWWFDWPGILLRRCYAMSSTELAYGATRAPRGRGCA
eukprot:1076059-Rhodomonas_salina.4